MNANESARQVFTRWPERHATKASWKYEHRRLLSKGASPSFFQIDGKAIPIYHFDQTAAMPKLSGFEAAKFEFLKRFWLHARHDRYLLCDEKTSTIDWNAQRLAGRKVPYFGESLVEQHLQGKKVYGIFSEESFRSRPAHTYWLAIDLDLHLETGGNLSIFLSQLQALLDRLWGHHKSQFAVSAEQVNGVHLYLNLPVLQSLDAAKRWLKTLLNDIHAANPELADEVAQWNEKLKAVGKNWKIRQINDLEIYPDEKHGFRFIGTKGKVLLAHKEIGLAQWGLHKRGKKKGQSKIGFDLEAWWESLQTQERMPIQEVLDFIKSRLPNEQPTLPELSKTTPMPPLISPVIIKPVENTSSLQPPATALKGQTRKILTDYWLGKSNPSGYLGKILIITARLLAAEGLSQQAAEELLQEFVREIPEEARHCSSRLALGDWQEIDRQIKSAVAKAFNNTSQAAPEASTNGLNKTIAAWGKVGFRLSDKKTWSRAANKVELPTIVWTDNDRLDFVRLLKPALKSKSDLIVEHVATGIVHLTIIKDQRDEGWGYEYLRAWLMDRFSIKCGKREKQAAIIKACQKLNLIKRTRVGSKGRASQWTVGSRALARLNGDVSDKWSFFDHKDDKRREEGRRLLEAGNSEILAE